ncbi:hypothetical protein CDV31_009423 [Fusarium ambrosium]|uniref:Uncharacterized protein n=1 Tax=Fusarium ambrosium TaxID=131363 RepID=A0A428TUV8_9HYPO|nr:hypothetical protein CDV31_009423 [Fusarium ambrosium]
MFPSDACSHSIGSDQDPELQWSNKGRYSPKLQRPAPRPRQVPTRNLHIEIGNLQPHYLQHIDLVSTTKLSSNRIHVTERRQASPHHVDTCAVALRAHLFE